MSPTVIYSVIPFLTFFFLNTNCFCTRPRVLYPYTIQDTRVWVKESRPDPVLVFVSRPCTFWTHLTKFITSFCIQNSLTLIMYPVFCIILYIIKVLIRISFTSNQLDAQLFFVCVYFYSLYVSGSHVPIIRRINYINTRSGIYHVSWHIPDVVLIQLILLMMGT
jgi:hypothetical protein